MERRMSIEVSEPLLREWGNIARHNKALHEAARAHFSGRSDASLILAVVLGSAGGLINILLGAVSPEYAAGGAVNVSQVALGFASVVSAAIISASKQLGWETKAHQHGEYASHYGELARLINSERTLALLDDSTFASVGDLIKKVQTELDKIEESAPPVPGFVEKMVVERAQSAPSASSAANDVRTASAVHAASGASGPRTVEMRQSWSPIGAGRAAGDSVARFLREIAARQETPSPKRDFRANVGADVGATGSQEDPAAAAGDISVDSGDLLRAAETQADTKVPAGPDAV